MIPITHNGIPATIKPYYQAGVFLAIDIHFAGLMSRLSGSDNADLFLAAALVSKQTNSGHSCLDLAQVADRLIVEHDESLPQLRCPHLLPWTTILKAASVVGSPGDFKPLILDRSSRLYLFRYWNYEQTLARAIRERACIHNTVADMHTLQAGLSRLFPDQGSRSIDWRKVAAFTAITRNMVVVCGGPGTGKTTTVAKIIALLCEQSCRQLHIAFAAPTGKAADRLQKTIQTVKKNLPYPETILAAIPETAVTLHRLMGIAASSAYTRFSPENPLPFDVIVIDEASMVDLSLMAKFFQAIRPESKIIMLGDKDQLASVETGTVLGDICKAERVNNFSASFTAEYHSTTAANLPPSPSPGTLSPLCDCIVELKENYRFGPNSGIAKLGTAVNRGNQDETMMIVGTKHHDDIRWLSPPKQGRLQEQLHAILLDGFNRYMKATRPDEALKIFERFRILCALREGPSGIKTLNMEVEKVLTKHHIIQPNTRWYCGRPIMITRNDYTLRLFNGDVGIILPDTADPYNLQAFFPGPDNTMRSFLPERLPEHETVYAMTIHKSQGSEFDEVFLVLPQQPSPVLTRELIYTAITRARKKVTIWGTEDIFRFAVSRCIARTSGLREALD